MAHTPPLIPFENVDRVEFAPVGLVAFSFRSSIGKPYDITTKLLGILGLGNEVAGPANICGGIRRQEAQDSVSAVVRISNHFDSLSRHDEAVSQVFSGHDSGAGTIGGCAARIVSTCTLAMAPASDGSAGLIRTPMLCNWNREARRRSNGSTALRLRQTGG